MKADNIHIWLESRTVDAATQYGSDHHGLASFRLGYLECTIAHAMSDARLWRQFKKEVLRETEIACERARFASLSTARKLTETNSDR